MTTVTAINNIDFDHGSSTPMQRSLRFWNVGLFVSALVGIVSGLAGLTIGFLTTLELVAPSTGHYAIGTVLLGSAFILFGLAAHCLDKADSADKAIRLEYCRQHGLLREEAVRVETSR